MCCFAHNDISMLLNFYFWQPVYYLIDPEDQSFGVKLKEKKARWAGVDEKIGAKMCYKLVYDNSGKIICRSVIRSATEPGTAKIWSVASASLRQRRLRAGCADLNCHWRCFEGGSVPI